MSIANNTGIVNNIIATGRKGAYNTKRNDLKFKTMAQYKALTNGDIFTYDLLDQNLMRRPSIRALALENSSIE